MAEALGAPTNGTGHEPAEERQPPEKAIDMGNDFDRSTDIPALALNRPIPSLTFMKHFSFPGLSFCLSLGVVALHPTALGDAISILNPSFEGLTGTDPAHFDTAGNLLPYHGALTPSESQNPALEYKTLTPVPGWQVSGNAGTGNYSGTQYFLTGSTDGQNVAFASGYQSLHGWISQTLGEHYQAGLTYELKVDVGTLIGYPAGGYTVSLFAGSTAVANAINTVAVTPGAFSTVTVSTRIDLGSAAAGLPITITLANFGRSQVGNQVVFDNVRLTSSGTAVPEPSPWALAMIGLFGWFAVGRIRRASPWGI